MPYLEFGGPLRDKSVTWVWIGGVLLLEDMATSLSFMTLETGVGKLLCVVSSDGGMAALSFSNGFSSPFECWN